MKKKFGLKKSTRVCACTVMLSGWGTFIKDVLVCKSQENRNMIAGY